MYFDTAYIAKFYCNETDSPRVRKLVARTDWIRSSYLAFTEFHAVLHRHVRQGQLSTQEARAIASDFASDIESGLWTLMPVSDSLLRRAGRMIQFAPPGLFLRTVDAVHLTAARDGDEDEIWTNDRHMLAAAEYFGLAGRSV